MDAVVSFLLSYGYIVGGLLATAGVTVLIFGVFSLVAARRRAGRQLYRCPNVACHDPSIVEGSFSCWRCGGSGYIIKS